MDFIWGIFNFSEGKTLLPAYLLDEEVNANQALPIRYYEVAMEKYGGPQKKLLIFAEIVKRLQKAHSAPAVVKILTVIFSAVYQNKYQEDILEILREIELPMFEENEQLSAPWLKELVIGCNSYLMRLSSLSQVFRRGHDKVGRSQLPLSTLLSDMFLLINLLGLFFPNLTNTFNSIGRYYLKSNNYFKELFKQICGHLMQSYDYLRFISSHIIKNYKQFDHQSLHLFVKTLPQIQLLCDKLQQALLNKYFKGRGPSQKIYFKVEQIQQISYYLTKPLKSSKDTQQTKSAQEDLFGQYVTICDNI